MRQLTMAEIGSLTHHAAANDQSKPFVLNDLDIVTAGFEVAIPCGPTTDGAVHGTAGPA